MSNTKLALVNTVFLFFRMLITMVISLFTSRIVLQALGVTDYGIYNVVGGMVSLISFLHYSLNGATIRFMNVEMVKGDILTLRKVFNSAMLIHVFIAFIIVIIAETIGLWFLYHKLNIPENRMFAASIVYQFSIAAVILNIIQVPYDSTIIAHQKMRVFAYVSILEALLKFGIAFFLLQTRYDKLITYSLLLLIVSFIIRLIYQMYCYFNFDECKIRFSFDKRLIKEIAVFFSWDIYGNLSALLRNQGTTILQNMFFGPLINAAMGIANIVSTTITLLVSNVSLALKPQIFQFFSKGDYNKAYNLVYFGSRVNFFLLLLITIPIFIETDFFLGIWLKEVPKFSVEFTQLMILSGLIGILYDLLTILINATGKIRSLSIIGGTTYLCSVVLVYFLLKQGFGIFTASVIHIFITLLMGGNILYIVNNLQEKFSIKNYLLFVIGKCYLIGILCVLVCYFIKRFINIDITLIRIFIYVIITIILISILGISKNEKLQLKGIILEYIPFINK